MALTDEDYFKMADEALEEAWELANSTDGWQELRNKNDAIVVTKMNKKGKKVYRVTGKIDLAPAVLITHLENTEELSKWNTMIQEQKVLKKLNDKVSIFYQIMDGGGVISARDFVFIAKSEHKDGVYVQGSCSVDYPDCAEVPKIVRAWHGPSALIVRPIEGKEEQCELVWLLDSDYRGWIPSNILTKAMPQQQMQFIRCVRKLTSKDEDAKKEEKEEAKAE